MFETGLRYLIARRDHCMCSECFNAATKQRKVAAFPVCFHDLCTDMGFMLMIVQTEPNLKAVDVKQMDQGVQVTCTALVDDISLLLC